MVTLESSKLFSQLPAAELQRLREAAREISFSPGQQIFKEGDPGDGIYTVKSGLVQISAAVEKGQPHVFSQALPGDVFGEMAVMDHQPRSAFASAEMETTVYFIPRQEMLALVQRSPELSSMLMREISRRLREFNIQYIQKLLQTERMALVGRFANSIVHDLKNPLTVINLTAELVCSPQASDEMRKNAQQRILRQIERITSMVNDILEFTRGEASEPELVPTNYSEFMRNVIEECRDELAVNSISVEYVNPAPVMDVLVSARRLSRVFYNLFSNAADAMPKGGRIRLSFRLHDREVITEIEDTGPGIATEIAERLFDPFVTFGKPRGTGLGLSICRKIIEDHHGTISARNQSTGGAVFSITLPRPPALEV